MSCIPRKFVCQAVNKSVTHAIISVIGHITAHNEVPKRASHASIAGIANHTLAKATPRADKPQTIPIITMIIVPFCEAHAEKRSSTGIAKFMASVSLSINPHFTISPFEKPPIDASVIPILSRKVDMTPEKVFDALSIPQKNRPHSAVASFIASSMSSNGTLPSFRVFLSSAIDIQVLRDMASSGLKPTFTIWSKSCPIKKPVAFTCEKDNDSDASLSLFPIAMSPSIFIFPMTSFCATQNPSIVEVAFAKSSLENGVFAAKSCISIKRALPFSAEPVSVSNC